MSTDPEIMVVQGDKSHLWSFTYFWTATAIAFGAIVTVFAPGKHIDNAWTLVIFPALAIVLSGIQCLAWRRRVLPARYEFSDDHVTVFIGTSRVASYAYSELVDVHMVGEMSYSAMAGSAGTFLPTWPSLQLTLEGEPGASPLYRRLPEVMIWGKIGKERADEAIRAKFAQRRLQT